jgi:Na+-driven multidrug efflux pump
MKDAKIYAKMSVLSAFLWGFFFVILMTLIRSQLTTLFTKEEGINSIVNQIYPMLQIYVMMDCLQMVGQGLINGIGK